MRARFAALSLILTAVCGCGGTKPYPYHLHIPVTPPAQQIQQQDPAPVVTEPVEPAPPTYRRPASLSALQQYPPYIYGYAYEFCPPNCGP